MPSIRVKAITLLVAAGMFLTGCGGSSSSNSVGTGNPVGGGTGPNPLAPPTPRVSNVWQNPFMSANPTNNVHCDSYMSDSYAFAGPTAAGRATVSQVSRVTFNDPTTGQPRTLILGECAAQAFDAQGNIQTVAAGLYAPSATAVDRYVVTLDRNTLQVLAISTFVKQLNNNSGTVDFGGAGYFYQDDQYRMVVALPNGHVQVLRRTPSTAGGVDGYTADRDINVTGAGGAVPVPAGLSALDLYAVVPDKAGNIWFTTAQAVVGTITPGGVIHWINLNDIANTGTQQPQPDGGFEAIANSHAVDEGDTANGPSGAYVVTTYRQYRFSAAADGTPQIDWAEAYDRGTGQKPGQVSFGSGTSPTVFRMGGRRFVTIADNAQFMHINVYRAEAALLPGEQRLFAQVAPFADNAEVSDENSLIVAPNQDGTSMDIYAENNWGNVSVLDTVGSAMTKPGFARVNLLPDGTTTVPSVNNYIAVPSLVSKVSLGSNTIYTYNKTASGWFLTGLDADNLNLVRFTTLVGPGQPAYNNFYAAMSLDADGTTCWIGTLFGLTRVQVTP